MGVEFDRILDGFTGPFEPVTDWNVKPPAGKVTTLGQRAAGYLIEPPRWWTRSSRSTGCSRRRKRCTGCRTASWYVPARPSTRARAREDRRRTRRRRDAPRRSGRHPERGNCGARESGLWDQYGGSMDSGWARWILEQYQFPFEKVFAPTLDAGNLNAKYDVLVFVEGGIPAAGGQAGGAQPARRRHSRRVPADAWARDRRATIPALRQFVENGGTVITIGASATNLARHFKLPIDRPPGRGRQAVAGGEVLRAGIGADGAGRRHASDSRTA